MLRRTFPRAISAASSVRAGLALDGDTMNENVRAAKVGMCALYICMWVGIWAQRRNEDSLDYHVV